MSRGVDGFNLDDFRDSDWGSGSENESYTLESFGFAREIGRGRGGSSSDPSARLRLQKLRDAESASDRAVSPEHRHKDINRARAAQDSRQVGGLLETSRARYAVRDRSYSLRTSEIETLTELGKFRVVNVDDLARFAYAGDRERLRSDLRNLTERRLIRRHGFVPEEQAIYSGLVKPKEADHDSALFELYQKAAAEIQSKGGKVLRVQLDYELK